MPGTNAMQLKEGKLQSALDEDTLGLAEIRKIIPSKQIPLGPD